MRRLLGAALLAAASTAPAQDPETQRAVQRALIQRDQQSAEFAAAVRGADVSRLQQLHAIQLRDAGMPLNPDPVVARELLPYERQRAADERTLFLSAPVVRAKPDDQPLGPLPLPGGPAHVGDPIPSQGTPH